MSRPDITEDIELIDVHAHFLPQALIDGLRARKDPPNLTEGDTGPVVNYGGGYIERLKETARDLDRLLAAMDRNQITRSVISINQPGVVGMPLDEAVSVARAANDELLDRVRGSAGRLVGLGTLPLHDPPAAVDELERIASVGLSGAIIVSNVGGKFISEPEFLELFEAAERLDVVLLLHPILPVASELFRPFDLTVPLGFLVDTTIAVIRLVLGGLYDRHPRLKLLLGHAGSLLPQIAGRIDLEAERNPGVRGSLSVLPSRHLSLLYTDTVTGSAAAVRSALSLFGSERVMFGSDYPFWDQEPLVSVIEELSQAGELPEGLRAATAMQVFGLERFPSAGRETSTSNV